MRGQEFLAAGCGSVGGISAAVLMKTTLIQSPRLLAWKFEMITGENDREFMVQIEDEERTIFEHSTVPTYLSIFY